MKGIILAGGKGSRLKPLTDVICKQLLPVYDKPMIFYPLKTLISLGINEVLIITDNKNLENFKKLLGEGLNFNISIKYEIQDKPNGIAEAFIIGKNFIKNDKVCLILGDNLFFTNDFFNNKTKILSKGSKIFLKKVDNPNRYGVMEMDSNFNPIAIHEKPSINISNFAVVGLYMFDNSVIKIAEKLIPSKRNELEITDINNIFLKNKNCECVYLPINSKWFDSGTFDSLLEASNYVKLKKI